MSDIVARECPDELVREAKMAALGRGISFKQFLVAAIQNELKVKPDDGTESDRSDTGGVLTGKGRSAADVSRSTKARVPSVNGNTDRDDKGVGKAGGDGDSERGHGGDGGVAQGTEGVETVAEGQRAAKFIKMKNSEMLRATRMARYGK